MALTILINGAPGSGKTTLLHKLAKDLEIGYITKDQFKELLGDSLGLPKGYGHSAAYGRGASDALMDVIGALQDVDITFIAESAFWADLASERLANIAKSFDSYLQIYVTCNNEVREKRFHDRISNGERHAVHWDKLSLDLTPDEISHRYRPVELPGLKTIFFDTTSSTAKEYGKLKQNIKEWRSFYETTN